MNKKRIPAVAASLCIAGLLAGCSGEPRESNMLDAVNGNAKFQMTLAMMLGLSGRNSAAALDEAKRSGVIEKSGCTQAQGAPGYVCDFRWGSRQPDGSVRYGTPIKGRFFKIGDGWTAEF